MTSRSYEGAAEESHAHPRWRRRLRVALAAGASGALAGALAMAVPAVASSSWVGTHYHFQTLNNSNDPTFNQLLGINNSGVIAGYFGSGVAGHPNKGYYLLPPRYSQLDYRIENFPGSDQTQVTGLNDRSTQVGFFAPTNTGNDANFGWYSTDNGVSFHKITVPHVTFSTPPVTQLLGVNNFNQAVGFYNDASGNSHGFVYSIKRHRFIFTTISGATSVTDAGINNRGDITGFFTSSSGAVRSFLRKRDGKTVIFSFHGGSATTALGVNDADEVVGTYTLGTGSSATLHGFTWTAQHGFKTVNDPHGVGTTTVNGVNDQGDLVGFYVDSAGNTDGMLATPQH
jgi:hypothetical protein